MVQDVVYEMRVLDEMISNCKLCELAESRTNTVPGSGRMKNVELVFVGEAPGRNEDQAGKPFVGAGGRLLDELINHAGLNRDEVYVTNIVKCRPPNNRKPELDEIQVCTANYLERQIKILDPLLICSLGATALEYFTGQKSIGAAHGKLTRSKNEYSLFPTYHPASIFRNRSLKEFLKTDIEKIPAILRRLRDDTKQTSLTMF